MSRDLASRIRDLRVEPGSLGLFWLAQAGFVYKTPGGTTIYVDAYLSDCVHRLYAGEGYGFKRLIPPPLEPEEVEAGLVVCTHSHADHFDYDSIPVFARNPAIHFVASPDCRAEFEKLGIPAGRYTILRPGQRLSRGDVTLTAVFADHGESAGDAVGVIVESGGVKVWQLGDTAYRPDMWQEIFQLGVDVIIPPINGKYGNLDGVEAAKLAHEAHAKVAIPCHFWLFAEHGGSPAQFMDACAGIAPGVEPHLMTVGELLIVKK